MSELEFCNLKSPQFCEIEVTSCRKRSFRSKKVFFEVPMSLVTKMTRLCGKMGSLHANLTPPNVYSSLRNNFNVYIVWLNISMN